MRIAHSELSPADVQRLINFCANHSHQTYAIAQTFVDRVSGQFPRFAAALPLQTQRQRANLGQLVAAFARSFGSQDAMRASCERAGRLMSRCGMHHGNVASVHAALVFALQKHSGADWTRDIESAWNQAINAWLTMASQQLQVEQSTGTDRVRKAA